MFGVSRNQRTLSKMRAALALVASALLALVLTGCAGINEQDAQQSIANGIATDMGHLQSLDSESATLLFASDFTTELVAAGIDPLTVYGPMFSEMTYTIDGIDVDAANLTAVAHLTIVNKDLTQALSNYEQSLSKSLLAASSDPSSTAVTDDGAFFSLMVQELVKAVTDPELGRVSSSVDIEYRYEDGVWKAASTEGLAAALLGGLSETILSANAA